MKKSKSYICSLGGVTDQTQSADLPAATSDTRVNFLIGDNESLAISSTEITEEKEDVVRTRGVAVQMLQAELIEKEGDSKEEEETEEDNFVEVVEVGLPPVTVTSSKPAELPALLCCSSSYQAGAAVQGWVGECREEQWRPRVQAELAATAAHHPLVQGGGGAECVAVVGEVDRGEVSLVSAQQEVVGRPGLPVPLSPLVANILDSTVGTADLGAPPALVLQQLEDSLQQLYLQSAILAEYLLTAQDWPTSLQAVSSALDLDPSDVPLLLAVASTHTPSLGQKYGLSFAV